MLLGLRNKCVSAMKRTVNRYVALSMCYHHRSRTGLTCIYNRGSAKKNKAGLRGHQAVLHTVSYMAKPAVTLPPGELIYRWIGFDVSSASRKRSCATMSAASVSRIYIKNDDYGLAAEK